MFKLQLLVQSEIVLFKRGVSMIWSGWSCKCDTAFIYILLHKISHWFRRRTIIIFGNQLKNFMGAKLTVTQLVKFSAFYRSQRFISIHMSLPLDHYLNLMNPVHILTPHSCKLLILSSRVHMNQFWEIKNITSKFRAQVYTIQTHYILFSVHPVLSPCQFKIITVP